MADFLEKLNEEQIRPVMYTEGAVLVIAGAGSGKTRVLTSRIAHLVIDKHVSPRNILAITFTNKAANEMKERLVALVGDVSDMWVCTIHSMCVRILRMFADKIGYDKNFSIYSETDKEKVLKRIIIDLALDNDKYFKPVRNYISSCKNKDMTYDDFAAENRGKIRDLGNFVRIMEKYDDELRRSDAFDFDDLLIKTYHLLAENKDVLEFFSDKFRYIHIDEFQDTNAVQYNIVRLLSVKHGNVFAVGDDDQSIYGWRGADINNILGFEKDFGNAVTFKLERNYRSTKKILDLANAIIKNNANRKSKTLWTDNDVGVKPEFYSADDESSEAQYTAMKIKNLVGRGYDYSDFAVLMRINALSRSYEQEFLKYGIPCKVFGGFKFFERKEIKDLTAYLRILCNPLDNEAVLRIINVPKRGIGAKSVEAIVDYSAKKELSVLDGIFDVAKLDLNAGARNKIETFKQLLTELIIDKENLGITDLVKKVIEKTEFMSCFSEDTEENEDKKANVNEFINSVEEFERKNPTLSLAEYLNSITLSSDTDDINESDVVTLATVHSVKGLEYKCVFICGLDKKIFPIERALDDPSDLEEERRLMYVAITRAKDRIFLTRSKSRFLYGSRQATAQSDFLDELADELGIVPSYRQNSNRYSYSSYGDRGGYDSFRGYDSYTSKGGTFKIEDMSSYGYGSSGSYGSYPHGAERSGPGSFVYGQREKKSTYSDSFNSAGNRSAENLRQADKDVSAYRPGTKVIHKKFGEGTIIDIKNTDGEVIGDIAFKGIGVKSLVLRLAPIELV